MSFEIQKHLPALLFLLLPVLLHLLRRNQVRTVEFSSLSLILARGRKSQQNLKLRRWLLLLVRTGLILFLVAWFLKPILHQAPDFLARHFPLEQAVFVYLDTRFDSAAELQKHFETHSDTAHLKGDFRILKDHELGTASLSEYFSSHQNQSRPRVLVSRAYGLTKTDITYLSEQNVRLLPYSTAKKDTLVLHRVAFGPKVAIGDEVLELTAQIQSNFDARVQASVASPQSTLTSQALQVNKGQTQSVNLRFQVPRGNPQLRLEVQSFAGETLATQKLSTQAIHHLSFALVADDGPVSDRTSSLYYVHSFLKAFQKMYEQRAQIDIKVFNSRQFKQSSAAFDWTLLGELNSPLPLPVEGRSLVFHQKKRFVQDYYNSHFEMASFGLSTKPALFSMKSMPASDRRLLPFANRNIHRRLLIKSTDHQVLIQAGDHPALIRNQNHYFSAFHFVPSDFGAVRSPLFPVLMIRLFLNRFEPQVVERHIELSDFSRPKDLDGIASDIDLPRTNSDISPLLLVFLLLFAILEIRLIKSISRVA